MNFMTVPASDLLQGHCLGGVPQRVSSHSLESILGPDGKDGEQKLGRQIGGQKRRKVEEGEVVVEAADVAFQKPVERESRRKDEVVGKDRRELVEPVLNGRVIRTRYPPVRCSHPVFVRSRVSVVAHIRLQ